MTRVLSVASECAPLVKTGGLADVVGALPGAMAALGDELRTLVPGYATMPVVGGAVVAAFDDLFGGPATVDALTHEGLDLLILRAPHLFDRPGGLYIDAFGADWPDNAERFAALSYAAAHVAAKGAGDWRADVVHGHDWQAGLVPEYLAGLGCDTPFILTIHNVAFHGNTGAEKLDALRLDPDRFNADQYEFWGQISALKAGLMGAAQITTVSQTYAEELMTPQFGMGMDGVLRHRRDALTGIVNGIDLDVWNPETDPQITPYTTFKGKAANKAALQAEFGLSKAPGPLCVLVSRLTDQKGIDLLLDAMHVVLERGGQVAVLGSGAPDLEVCLLERADAEPNLAVKIGYDEALSHRMMAGGDCILVPSRFEPCGLTQLYGLRYGTLPLVALTGGLADTVINASPAALARRVATGIQFSPITAEALANAFSRLCDLYADRKTWTAMVRNAMKQPVGWDMSASRYHALYKATARK
ncbi:glycogen synthase GlgA [Jannaschia sp. CCS1]|uniref:Glycogen synthase n=1 Tax=Jannaschia sp. (strain CCS1) TaxID=290400 RepID=GLGA_JANSC|nr:glycogen synthase GlgA [Jannaschia sp. CCS1]Q28MN0.1 RecName: Full=Glycogen synthase; AltName: Full=Starch [bacterial glycogen] synthase [Jannaschia sp. CCS1]ABD56032.1 glycogen synthase (ADP-glucose) [Jannaschia sp. CCS1]